MVCPFKKNITTTTKHEADGTRTETKTVTFGTCELHCCPYYESIKKCTLMRGNP